ncbi:hypothetical protein VA596_28410 [Amycolatopsis sp., V23-08]|uniref:Uncharacterized protein n=1 Tax=Amycolatopsis heterodermiae TaxID=3110235 RepID=A0ABU5RCX4_9PSEU|nr:hypothetical protein [Amycolatopsis sp., V23-08]MEA5363484.1 hypothetical protein [Amycolatopsis sp., V23-08]
MDRGERSRGAPAARSVDRRANLRGSERLLLALQEQAGNRAVQGVITGSRVPVVQRATGLAADVGGFVGSLTGAFDGWSAPTADVTSRRKALATAINERLGQIGVPKISLLPGLTGTGGSVSGTFHPATWILDVSPDSLQQPALNTQQRAELADTVLHESRHAEQFFRAARLLCAQESKADSQKKKTERRDDNTIADSVAKTLNMALDVVRIAQKAGGELSGEEEKEARQWSESIPYNADVHKQLQEKKAAWQLSCREVRDFQRDYTAAPKWPNHPRMPIDNETFQGRFKNLEKRFDQTFVQYGQAYRMYQLGLSFEADAWQVGQAAYAAVDGKPPADLDTKLATLRAPWDSVLADWRAWLITAPPRPHRDPSTIQQLVQRHAIPAELESLREDVEPAS